MGAPAQQPSDPPRTGYVSLGEVDSPSGDLTPATVVAGLPLLVRLARQVARLGVGRVILVSSAPVEPWRKLLAQHHVNLEVDTGTPEDVPTGVAVLEAMALYDADTLAAVFEGASDELEPRVRVSDEISRQEAEAWLWGSIRKSMSHDGPVSYFLARPVSGRISRLLLPTGVAPNAVTLFGLAVGLGSGAAAAAGGYGAVLAATLLFYLGMILDCVDGDLARIKLATSRRGQWLDSITDDLSVVFLTLGMGVGLWRVSGQALYLWAGLTGAGLVVVGQAVIYGVLARGPGPIDTAKYPWFFLGGEGLAQEGKRSLFGYLSFAARRDSLTLAFVILAVVGQGPAILAVLAGGGAFYFVLLGVDRVVKALQSGEGAR
jgi:phosphatidylglycerophosphate synthase